MCTFWGLVTFFPIKQGRTDTASFRNPRFPEMPMNDVECFLFPVYFVKSCDVLSDSLKSES